MYGPENGVKAKHLIPITSEAAERRRAQCREAGRVPGGGKGGDEGWLIAPLSFSRSKSSSCLQANQIPRQESGFATSLPAGYFSMTLSIDLPGWKYAHLTKMPAV